MKNDLYEVSCININNYAKGVTKIDSLLVFTDDFYPGEKALISIKEEHKNYSFGKVERLITPSIHRIKKVCNHEDSGTCPFNDISYEYELELKKSIVRNNISRELNVDIKDINITSGDTIDGYRNKVTVFFKKESNHTIFGTFKENTNELIKIDSCVQINNKKLSIIKSITSLLDRYNLDIVDFIKKTGNVKGVVIRESSYNQKINVMFLLRYDSNVITDISNELSKLYPDISSISINIDKSFDTFIYGGIEKILIGDNTITEKILDTIFKVDNQSFLQVNTSCASKLYKRAIELANLKKSDTILDLYSGCGGISLNASKYVKEVIGIETVPSAIDLARKNALSNNINNATFFVDDAANYNEYIKDKNVKKIFVDPPRKGLDKKMIDLLNDNKFDTIIYVSCDPYTLSRDIKLLKETYKLNSIECFDMFPRTRSVEVLTKLIRK